MPASMLGGLLLLTNSIAADQHHSPPPKEGSTADLRQSPRRADLEEGYHIGAGDVLQVSVWKEPDASVPAVVVRADGKIALPLAKEVDVMGLTPKEAEQIITDRLHRLIPSAEVTVLVLATNSKKVYIVGAVKTSGPMRYAYRMTVMQALTEAGGLSENAKRKKIYILRNENGKDSKLPFNYDAVIKGERMDSNIALLPGDTLVVPPVH